MVSSLLEFVIVSFFSLPVWRKELNHTGMVVALAASQYFSLHRTHYPFLTILSS